MSLTSTAAVSLGKHKLVEVHGAQKYKYACLYFYKMALLCRCRHVECAILTSAIVNNFSSFVLCSPQGPSRPNTCFKGY